MTPFLPWMTEHPWMTFFLVWAAIWAVTNILSHFFRMFYRRPVVHLTEDQVKMLSEALRSPNAAVKVIQAIEEAEAARRARQPTWYDRLE